MLLATENAPPGKRAWYGMFPQLGAPIGFFLSTGIFLLLTAVMDDAQFFAWGWRVPFLASAVLVLVGLWVRLRIDETPAFQRVLDTRRTGAAADADGADAASARAACWARSPRWRRSCCST